MAPGLGQRMCLALVSLCPNSSVEQTTTTCGLWHSNLCGRRRLSLHHFQDLSEPAASAQGGKGSFCAFEQKAEHSHFPPVSCQSGNARRTETRSLQEQPFVDWQPWGTSGRRYCVRRFAVQAEITTFRECPRAAHLEGMWRVLSLSSPLASGKPPSTRCLSTADWS